MIFDVDLLSICCRFAVDLLSICCRFVCVSAPLSKVDAVDLDAFPPHFPKWMLSNCCRIAVELLSNCCRIGCVSAPLSKVDAVELLALMAGFLREVFTEQTIIDKDLFYDFILLLCPWKINIDEEQMQIIRNRCEDNYFFINCEPMRG